MDEVSAREAKAYDIFGRNFDEMWLTLVKLAYEADPKNLSVGEHYSAITNILNRACEEYENAS